MLIGTEQACAGLQTRLSGLGQSALSVPSRFNGKSKCVNLDWNEVPCFGFEDQLQMQVHCCHKILPPCIRIGQSVNRPSFGESSVSAQAGWQEQRRFLGLRSSILGSGVSRLWTIGGKHILPCPDRFPNACQVEGLRTDVFACYYEQGAQVFLFVVCKRGRSRMTVWPWPMGFQELFLIGIRGVGMMLAARVPSKNEFNLQPNLFYEIRVHVCEEVPGPALLLSATFPESDNGMCCKPYIGKQGSKRECAVRVCPRNCLGRWQAGTERSGCPGHGLLC